jgi:hypothetical protein
MMIDQVSEHPSAYDRTVCGTVPQFYHGYTQLVAREAEYVCHSIGYVNPFKICTPRRF